MLRIGLMLFFLLLIGTQLLSYFGSTDASSLIVFVVIIAIGIAVLKLILDFVLHGKKSKEDEDIEQRYGEDAHVRTYEDIDEYMKAAKRRDERS